MRKTTRPAARSQRLLVVGRLSALLLAVVAIACAGSSLTAPEPTRQVASVTFELVSPPVPPPQGAQEQFNWSRCLRTLGQARISQPVFGFGWTSATFFPTRSDGDRWILTVPDVPAGREHVILVTDPNACARAPFSSNTTEGVSVNGVRLARRTTFPVTDTPALLFSVSAEGVVSP